MDETTVSKLKNYYSVFQILAALLSVVIVGANIYVATKLAPVVQDLDSISTRVKAIEEDRKTVPEYRARMVALEANNKAMQEDVRDIKEDTDTLTKFLLNR